MYRGLLSKTGETPIFIGEKVYIYKAVHKKSGCMCSRFLKQVDIITGYLSFEFACLKLKTPLLCKGLESGHYQLASSE